LDEIKRNELNATQNSALKDAEEMLGISLDIESKEEETEQLSAFDRFLVFSNENLHYISTFCTDMFLLAIFCLLRMSNLGSKLASRFPVRKAKKGSSWGLFLILLVVIVNFSLLTDTFLQKNNFLSILQQISTNFILAVGMTLVILTGGIDLSVGSNVGLATQLLAVMLKKLEMPIIPSILLVLAISALFGLVNGTLISRLNLTPFIATLVTMYVGRGMTYALAGGETIFNLPEAFTALANRVYGVPIYCIITMVCVFVAGVFLLKYTILGRNIYAVGGNENCARLSGVRIAKTTMLTYTLNGLCCGIAAVLMLAKLNSAYPTNGDGLEMDAIAAVVIGGTSMSGGEGGLKGTLIGIFFIGIVSNGLNLLGVGQGPQKMVKGIIIAVAVALDIYRRKKAAEQVKS